MHPLHHRSISFLTGLLFLVAGVLYATGFLVATTFFGRLGIRDTGADLLKAEYIQIGVLFWALPLAIASPFLSLRVRSAKMPPELQVTGRTAVLLALMLANFYLLAIFAPPGFISDDPRARRATTFFLITVFAFALVMVMVNVFASYCRSKLEHNPRDATAMEVLRIISTVRRVLHWVLGAVYIVFCFGFGYLLRDRLGELVMNHGLPFACLIAILSLVGVVIWRLLIWDNAYRDDRTARVNLWCCAAPVIGLLGYLALLAFAHSVHVYIPAPRGGGDFVTMPRVRLVAKEIPPNGGSLGLLALDSTGRSVECVLLRESATDFYLAVISETDKPLNWRRYMSRPQVIAIPREMVRALEYQPEASLR